MDDWYAVGPGRSTCKKCGEERLVHEVADARGIQNFCQVCTNSWWLSGPMTSDMYKARRVKVATSDVAGVPMFDP